MSLYIYLNNYNREGFDGLKEQSKRTNTIHKTDKKIDQKVIQLRNKDQCCHHKIQETLANQYKRKIGRMTIYRSMQKWIE